MDEITYSVYKTDLFEKKLTIAQALERKIQSGGSIKSKHTHGKDIVGKES